MEQVIEDLDRKDFEDLQQSLDAMEEVFDRINSRTPLRCQRIYAIEAGQRVFEAIYFIRSDEPLSGVLSEARAVANEVFDELAERDFRIEYHFAPVYGEIDHDAVVTDGYTFYFPASESEEVNVELVH